MRSSTHRFFFGKALSFALLAVLLSAESAYPENTFLPAMGTWNAFNRHQNVLECNNGEDIPLSLKIQVLSNSNELITTNILTIAAHGTNQLLLSHPKISNAYGTYLLTTTSAPNHSITKLNCLTVIYRMAPLGADKRIEYAYALPVRAPLQGETYGVYNSINPEPTNPQPVYNWLSLINQGTKQFTASVLVYQHDGSIDEQQSFEVTLFPRERKDFALGHQNGHEVGLFRLVPRDLNQAYEGFLTRFSESGGEFNFAFPLRATPGGCIPGPVPASTMGDAFNWGEVANPTTSPIKTNIVIRNANGEIVHQETKSIPPRSQHHVFINAFLGDNKVGTFEARCADPSSARKKLLVQSLYYGHDLDDHSSVTWAYASQATGAFVTNGQSVITPFNTFLGAANWHKIIDRNGVQTQFTSTIFDSTGKMVSPGTFTMDAKGTLDIGVHEKIGADKIGFALGNVRTPNAAFTSESLRVFLNARGRIDTIMNIPDGVVSGPVNTTIPAGFLSPLVKIFKVVQNNNRTPTNIATIENFTQYFTANSMMMLQNEAESIQLAMKSSSAQNVSVNYLLTRNGEPSTSLAIEMYRTDFANVTYLLYSAQPTDYSPVGYYTDPLLSYIPGANHLTDGPTFWWITARSRANTRPGTYTLTFYIQVDGELIERSIAIEVLDYALPKESFFHAVFDAGFNAGPSGYTPFDYHRANTNSRKRQVAAKYLDYYSKNRLNHPTPYYDPACSSCGYIYSGAMNLPVTGLNLATNSISIDYTSFDRLTERYFDEGRMNFLHLFSSSWGFYHFYLPLVYGDAKTAQNEIEFAPIQQLYWSNVANHLAQKGWLDKTFVYIDEPFIPERGGAFIPHDNRFTDILKSVSPETSVVALIDRFAINYTSLIGTLRNIDYYAIVEYVPEYLWQPEQENPLRVLRPVVEQVMDEGDKLGTYWTSGGHLHIDRPTIDARIWGWKYWKNDIHFLLHWNVLIFAYELERGLDNPWETVSYKWGAGGVTLFYPPCKSGLCAAFNGNIIPSIRSEMYRDALDDFDSVVMLEDLIRRAEIRGIDTTAERATLDAARGLIQDLNTWTRNVALFEVTRKQVLSSIEHLSQRIR